uniref:Uncharacterized protein n=1 Tax=Piliocolobus tephrosceles TaxID=591936 RepID=A0A8C9I178_9PRIM
MTAEEMKETETWEQLVPLPMEGVDISPKQEEGMLKAQNDKHHMFSLSCGI